MHRRILCSTALLVCLPAGTFAADIDHIDLLTQRQFEKFSENLSSAASYKAISPAEPLGITGFDIGVEVTATEITADDAWDTAVSGDAPSYLALPKLHLHKGLPFDIDVGAFYTAAPGTNIRLWGAELRYAFLEGGVAMPAVAVRASYTRLSGVDQLDFATSGIDLSISKGFAVLTPYAGIGSVWADSQPKVAGLKDESIQQGRLFAGLNINLGLMNVALEGDRTGDASSYGVKVGMRF